MDRNRADSGGCRRQIYLLHVQDMGAENHLPALIYNTGKRDSHPQKSLFLHLFFSQKGVNLTGQPVPVSALPGKGRWKEKRPRRWWLTARAKTSGGQT